MSGADESELYELLLEMDALEELLELLRERGLASLTEFDERAAMALEDADLRALVQSLLARGINTVADIEAELAALEQRVDELGVPGSNWTQPN